MLKKFLRSARVCIAAVWRHHRPQVICFGVALIILAMAGML